MRLSSMVAIRLPSALCLALLAAPLAASAGESDKSAAIEQVVRQTTTSERSRAAFEQISAGGAQGKVDQIDPAARAGLSEDVPGLAPARAGRSSRQGCDVSPAQAAILETLRAQGRILGDDCELAEWVAITPDRSAREDRRATAEAASALRPEKLTVETERVRERAEAEEASRREAARAAISAGLALKAGD